MVCRGGVVDPSLVVPPVAVARAGGMGGHCTIFTMEDWRAVICGGIVAVCPPMVVASMPPLKLMISLFSQGLACERAQPLTVGAGGDKVSSWPDAPSGFPATWPTGDLVTHVRELV